MTIATPYLKPFKKLLKPFIREHPIDQCHFKINWQATNYRAVYDQGILAIFTPGKKCWEDEVIKLSFRAVKRKHQTLIRFVDKRLRLREYTGPGLHSPKTPPQQDQ